MSGVSGRLVGQRDAPLRRLDQRVTEQLGDSHHVQAVHGGSGCQGVAKVVKPQPGQSSLVADAVPLRGDVVDGPRRRAGKRYEQSGP